MTNGIDTFAGKLAARVGLSKEEARQAIKAIFSTDAGEGIIAEELDAGRDFTITGFGTFGVRRRTARLGRNPQTGEKIEIPAMTVPSFRAGKGLKDRVRR